MRMKESRAKGYQGMDEKHKKETGDGRKEGKDRKRQKANV